MSETLTIKHRVLVLLALCFFGNCGQTVLQAEDTDGNLVPNDPNDFVILTGLLTGQVPSFTVGDKEFSMFSYTNAGDMPAAADVKVFGFQDLAGNFGFSLQGVFWDFGGDEVASAATLAFDVGVSSQGQELGNVISDAHLFLGGTGLSLDEESEVSVDESFTGASETLRVFSSTIGGTNQNKLSDFVDFSQTDTSLHVTVVIFATAAENADQPARASVIDLSFSQIVVPEPSSALLMLLAGTTAAMLRSRRGLIVG
jgi:hypothetical protein